VEEQRIEGAIVEEPEEAPRSSWVLVGQFFLVPIVIVGLCVGIFVLFGLITSETRTARDYLDEIKAGNGNRRWQAAFELSKYLTEKHRSKDPRLGRDLGALFRSSTEDSKVRQYLALAIGRLGDATAAEPLMDGLNDSDPDTRLYVAWALGQLHDARAVDPLIRLVEAPDPNLRKMAIYSLGMLADQRAAAPLRGALNDSQQDVRWNSALALARLRDPAGTSVLHQMLDRKHLDSLPGVNENQKSDAIINAARATALLGDATARPLLEEIGSHDKDLKVRSAALDALKQLK
jgi:HEAT repeat protein